MNHALIRCSIGLLLAHACSDLSAQEKGGQASGGVAFTAPSPNRNAGTADPFAADSMRPAGARSARAHGTGGPAQIRFSEATSAARENLQEDLGVMALILEKNLRLFLEPAVPNYRMGIPMLLRGQPSPRLVRAMYLDGFGALFEVNVNLPLMRPNPLERAEEANREPASEWERARRQLRGQPPQRVYQAVPTGSEPGTPEYNAQRVEYLKREILRSLAEASNIRGLAPEEFVAVVASGPVADMPAGDPGGDAYGFGAGGYGGFGAGGFVADSSFLSRYGLGNPGGGGFFPATGGTPLAPTALLNIRVTKEAVDEAAHNESTIQALQEKASISVYSLDH